MAGALYALGGLLLLGAALWFGRLAWRMAIGEQAGARSHSIRTGLIAISLAIVALIIMAAPTFLKLKQLSERGATLGSAGAIRSALSIYYGDTKGHYPADLQALTKNGKYLTDIPPATPAPFHTASSAIRYAATSDDAGGWAYDNVPGDANLGAVWINCTHSDDRGTAWSSY